MKRLITALLAILLSAASVPKATAQDWPAPLIELVSVSSDVSGYYETGQLKFTVNINRINGSSYSDITRVWFCPKASWDGFLCNSGQVLVSTTPDSTTNQILITSPVLVLADGEYVITTVTFRNGAELSGYTLLYPRSGVVTIGGIATTITPVNLSLGDFTLTPPPPAPEPEPEPEPEPTEEPTEEPEPIEQQGETGEGEAESSPAESTEPELTETELTEPESTESELTESENTNAETTESEETEVEESQEESVTEETLTQPGDLTQSGEPDQSTTQPTATESTQTQPDNSSSVTGPSAVAEQPAAESVIQPQPVAEPTTEPTAEVTQTQPTDQVMAPLLQPSEPVVTQAFKTQLTLASAIGGKVLKLTGNATLQRRISAGSGKLLLIASNSNGRIKLKVGSSKPIWRDLRAHNGNLVISWQRKLPGMLRITQVGAVTDQVLIDTLQLNVKLIANPRFQMRN
jgi:hypothetical protein